MRVNLKVTQEHINKGKRHIHSSCPVALALKDVFRKEYECIGMQVGAGRAIFYLDCEIYHINFPRKIKMFINNFDSGFGYWLIPFEIDLDYEQGEGQIY